MPDNNKDKPEDKKPDKASEAGLKVDYNPIPEDAPEFFKNLEHAITWKPDKKKQ